MTPQSEDDSEYEIKEPLVCRGITWLHSHELSDIAKLQRIHGVSGDSKVVQLKK
jgi:hypothetical protein